MSKKEIKHIVFDLGGVIVTLNLHLTNIEFSILSGKSVDEVSDFLTMQSVFKQYERGLTDNVIFRNKVRALLKVEATDKVIDRGWNAMIMGVMKSQLDLLKALKQKYHVTILSNTNDIHITYVHQLLKKYHGLEDFSSLVHQVYYSHEINLRKPDREIYQYVLDNAPYSAQETLFLDDNLENVEGAAKLGIQTIQVMNLKSLPTLLENEGIKY